MAIKERFEFRISEVEKFSVITRTRVQSWKRVAQVPEK
jgi:hypothetical protein